MKEAVITYGIAHGRFQPFHLEHLNYVQSIMTRCQVCVVAITSPVPTEQMFEETSSHRHLTKSNPYTFFDRAEMIRRSLLSLSVNTPNFTIVPLHLNDPAQWEQFLPPRDQSVFFVRVFSDWERKKIRLFQDNGYNVEQIDVGYRKCITATDVRFAIKKGDNWKHLVPKGTCETIENLVRWEDR